MRFEEYSFGSIRIDGVSYAHDLIIDRGKIRKRKKAASKRSATRTDTPPSRSRRRSPGGVAGWWSAPVLVVRCRSCRRSRKRHTVGRSNF